jgi:hypothetical protein
MGTIHLCYFSVDPIKLKKKHTVSDIKYFKLVESNDKIISLQDDLHELNSWQTRDAWSSMTSMYMLMHFSKSGKLNTRRLN